jgi:DNA-binding HxlR family transcriptional regulator
MVTKAKRKGSPRKKRTYAGLTRPPKVSPEIRKATKLALKVLKEQLKELEKY